MCRSTKSPTCAIPAPVAPCLPDRATEGRVKWIWGGRIRSIPPPDLFSGSVTLWGATVPSYRMFVIASGLVMAGVLWLLIERTRLGAIIRAGVFDSEMAAGMGINVDRVFTGVFAFGAGLAGLSGVIAGPIQSAQPPMGATILVPALIVVVVGGLGSLKGSLVGSLIIGQAETFGKAWLPEREAARQRAPQALQAREQEEREGRGQDGRADCRAAGIDR